MLVADKPERFSETEAVNDAFFCGMTERMSAIIPVFMGETDSARAYWAGKVCLFVFGYARWSLAGLLLDWTIVELHCDKSDFLPRGSVTSDRVQSRLVDGDTRG